MNWEPLLIWLVAVVVAIGGAEIHNRISPVLEAGYGRIFLGVCALITLPTAVGMALR